MTTSKSAIAALIGGVFTLGVGMMAFAESDRIGSDAQERTAFQKAAIGLPQAISSAESQSGGRAMSAEFEMEDGLGIFEVELLVADSSEIEVLINASTGQVMVDDNGKTKERH
jgi:uncharacterized membrane protein YkoI